jgi:hypothetical protein
MRRLVGIRNARLADGFESGLGVPYNAFPAPHGSAGPVAPYSRSIVRGRAAFGIWHTRVPTSRRADPDSLRSFMRSPVFVADGLGSLVSSGRMYKDVYAATNVVLSLDHRSSVELTVASGGGKRTLCILTHCSTVQAPPIRSAPLTSSRYSPTAPYPVGSTHGPTTRTTKTLRKVFVRQSLKA